MPTDTDRDYVRRLIEGGAQLIEVLPSNHYEEEHLPGAITIPLKKLGREATAQLERDLPVITEKTRLEIIRSEGLSYGKHGSRYID